MLLTFYFKSSKSNQKHIIFFVASIILILISTRSNILEAGWLDWFWYQQQDTSIFPIEKTPPDSPRINPFQENNFPDFLRNEYTPFEYLGHGKDGHVFLCQRASDGCFVAIKAMSNTQHGDHDTVKRSTQLYKEGFFNRQGIVKIYDDFISDDNFWHITIQEWLPANIMEFSPLSPIQTKVFLLQLLEVIIYCHGENIVHRDINPANLFIDTQGRLTVIDWESSKMYPPNTYSIVDHHNPEEDGFIILASEADDKISSEMSHSIVFTPGYRLSGNIDSPYHREYHAIAITAIELIIGQQNAQQLPEYDKKKTTSENIVDILSQEQNLKDKIYGILQNFRVENAYNLATILEILLKEMATDEDAIESARAILGYPYFNETKT